MAKHTHKNLGEQQTAREGGEEEKKKKSCSNLTQYGLLAARNVNQQRGKTKLIS